MRIPMVFVGPGIAANVVSAQFAQLHDLMPTVAALLGIDPPASSEGSALLGANAAAFSRPTAYFQYYDLHRGIRTADRWKFIGYRLTVPGPQFDRVQLFDLNADPRELNDLSAVDAYQTKLSALQSLLASQRARYDDPLVK